MMTRLAIVLTLLLTPWCLAADLPVADVAAFDRAVKQAQPGDVIVLRAGAWKDADLLLRGAGTPGKPITLRGQGVKLTGKSRLRIAGQHLVVEGLWFDNCLPDKGEIVSFREDSKRLASHCAMRQCAITQRPGTKDDGERKWLSLYGVENVVERCHFQGKTSPGTLLVVWLGEKSSPPKHLIARNYFGPRPRLGKNGGEIIRIGDSNTSMQSAECVVENNFFEKCDGEVECVSNKSCGNIYRGNFFLTCQGTLTLRHGNGCLVEKNVFVGNGEKSTGGIRVIGEDHRVIDNQLDGLTGDDARSAICLMNGIKDSPASGYFQVKRAIVSGNTVVDCKQSIVIGYGDDDVKATLPPVDCRFIGNRVWADKRPVVVLVDPKAEVAWEANHFWGAALGIEPVAGIRWGAFERPPTPALPDRTAVGCDFLPSEPLK